MPPRQKTVTQELGLLELRARELDERHRDLVSQHLAAQLQVGDLTATRKHANGQAAINGTEADLSQFDGDIATATQRVKDLAERCQAVKVAARQAREAIVAFRNANRPAFIEKAVEVAGTEAATVAKVVKCAREALLARQVNRSTWARVWGEKYRIDAQNDRDANVLSHYLGRLPVERIKVGGHELDPFTVLDALVKHFDGPAFRSTPPAYLPVDQGQGQAGLYMDVCTGREVEVTRLELFGDATHDPPIGPDPAIRAAVTRDEDGCCRFHFIRSLAERQRDPRVSEMKRGVDANAVIAAAEARSGAPNAARAPETNVRDVSRLGGPDADFEISEFVPPVKAGD